jgi:hypothetical protein
VVTTGIVTDCVLTAADIEFCETQANDKCAHPDYAPNVKVTLLLLLFLISIIHCSRQSAAVQLVTTVMRTSMLWAYEIAHTMCLRENENI